MSADYEMGSTRDAQKFETSEKVFFGAIVLGIVAYIVSLIFWGLHDTHLDNALIAGFGLTQGILAVSIAVVLGISFVELAKGPLSRWDVLYFIVTLLAALVALFATITALMAPVELNGYALIAEFILAILAACFFLAANPIEM